MGGDLDLIIFEKKMKRLSSVIILMLICCYFSSKGLAQMATGYSKYLGSISYQTLS
jgi:hypothetical protein